VILRWVPRCRRSFLCCRREGGSLIQGLLGKGNKAPQGSARGKPYLVQHLMIFPARWILSMFFFSRKLLTRRPDSRHDSFLQRNTYNEEPCKTMRMSWSVGRKVFKLMTLVVFGEVVLRLMHIYEVRMETMRKAGILFFGMAL
jgi:hypothetical protein